MNTQHSMKGYVTDGTVE